MGILNRLFGKSPANPLGGGGKISVYALLRDMEGQVANRRCDIDGRTFPCFANHPNFPLGTDEFVLDVGGYCPSCRGYRCEQHAKFGDGAKIVCARCGTALTGGSE